MKFFAFALLASSVSALPQAAVYPAGVNPAECIDYPLCPVGYVAGSAAVADLPVPIINGQAVAPVLNTLPAQTQYYQEAQLVRSPADFPVPIINGEAVAPVLNTLPAQTRYYQESQLVKSPANFPVPIINGEAVAPGLNTVPAQTRAHEIHQLTAAENQLQQLKDQQLIQIRQQQQEIEAARHFGRL